MFRKEENGKRKTYFDTLAELVIAARARAEGKHKGGSGSLSLI